MTRIVKQTDITTWGDDFTGWYAMHDGHVVGPFDSEQEALQAAIDDDFAEIEDGKP